MRITIPFVVYGLLQVANAINRNPVCAANNCVRAVGAPARSGSADCAAFLEVTVFDTTTVTPTAYPKYASRCKSVARYSSACSCHGVIASTTTISATLATPTHTPSGNFSSGIAAPSNFTIFPSGTGASSGFTSFPTGTGISPPFSIPTSSPTNNLSISLPHPTIGTGTGISPPFSIPTSSPTNNLSISIPHPSGPGTGTAPHFTFPTSSPTNNLSISLPHPTIGTGTGGLPPFSIPTSIPTNNLSISLPHPTSPRPSMGTGTEISPPFSIPTGSPTNNLSVSLPHPTLPGTGTGAAGFPMPTSNVTCPFGRKRCEASGKCLDLFTDRENCGGCGNVCPSGSVCKSGICSSPTCDTSTCGTLNGCQPGCFCFSDTSGLGFCGPNTACEPLVSGCKDNNECGDGEVCAVGTCCGHNVCLGACDREKMRREAQEMEERGLMANGTTAVGMFTGGAPVGQLW